MSKNVAVFVDVANIFYAAKAAGVDIDYVQMLKTATAGRDLVRAYAYTGLDPENENQRQFHSFLARHGYKVVSKDSRKYGDGKTKANLDIELFVDLMRTSHNLDIAVVVSGDGDFAPAIRAVQDQGVRVEVISFRANTSSDLIDVADLFTDITHIARVDKDSSRSGRRVASEDDDLSMTAVPEKESDGTGTRRRRGGRTRGSERNGRGTAHAPVEAEFGAEAEAPAAAGEGLRAMPGERLSRTGRGASDEAEVAEEGGEETSSEVGPDTDGEGGRRRRRRRGGRGRGRSHQPDEAVAADGAGDEDVIEAEGEVAFEAPAAPQRSTFVSVCDSQLGVTPGAVSSAEPFDLDEEDEPEIPEYLLSERRQRGRGHVPGSPSGPGGQAGRRPRGGRAGAYRSALDRERFGTGRNALPTPAYEGRRAPRTSGPGRPRGGERQFGGSGGGSSSRPEREERPFASGGGRPWSEVPPELEEQLRAELARKRASAPSPEPVAAAAAADAGATASARASKPSRTAAPRTRRSSVTSVGLDDGATGSPAAPAPARATRTRKAAAKPAASSSESTAGVEANEATAASPKARPAARTSRTTRTRGEANEVTASTGDAEPAPKATARRTSRSRTSADRATGEG